jgi:hypothetical protein
MLRSKLLALAISALIPGIFLWLVIASPSFFNILPFAIHQAMYPTKVHEHTFIVGLIYFSRRLFLYFPIGLYQI